MKKVLALLLALCVCMSLFVGCSDSAEKIEGQEVAKEEVTKEAKPEEPASEEVTIRFLTRMGADVNSADAAILAKLKEFDEMNENITIVDESVPGADDKVFFDKVKTAIAVGDLPDLIHNYGGGSIREYVNNDLFLDLDPYFEEDPQFKDNFMDMFDLWQYPGVDGTFGVPIRYFGIQLFYNKDMFEENGIEVPETLEEFEAACQQFLDKGITPFALGGGNSWRMAHLSTVLEMKKYGPGLMGELAAREKKYTDEEMLSIFTTVKDWQNAGYFGENMTAVDYDMEIMMFVTEESPMHMDGTWVAEQIATAGDEEGINFGVVNFPYYSDVPENKYYSMGGADGGFSVVKTGDAAREEATVELVKYLMSPEATTFNYESGGTQLIPVKTEKSPFPDTTFYNELFDTITNPEALYRQEVDLYDPLAQMTDTYRNALQGMVAGLTPDEALQQIQAEIDNNN